VGVLIVVMLLSMIALSVLFRMRSEETAGATGSTSEQGWATAMSGVREAMRLAPTFQPGDTTWMDAPERFKDRMLYDDGTEEWRWTLYSENPEGGIRVGLTDEASKLNLNSATTSMVSRLPGMKVSLTDALLDFLDADDVPRPEGAEQEYYNALPQPYRMHNGPLSTVEQLLLVRGFSPSVVLGEVANRNFSLDPNEDDGDELAVDQHDWRPHGARE
jgi:type II secretory pathway component PulK